jgi:hypothetical protein
VSDHEFFSYEVPRPHIAWVTIERQGPEAVRENAAAMESVTRLNDRFDYPKPLIARVNADYPAVREMSASADAKEGPLSFSEKRPPKWTGR